jgi:hypothetical protein
MTYPDIFDIASKIAYTYLWSEMDREAANWSIEPLRLEKPQEKLIST